MYKRCRRCPQICIPLLGPGHDDLTLFTEGDDLYTAMLTAIADAEHEIQMASYIFADDAVGWQFAQALAERVRRGVQVRLQLDAAGSWWSWSERLEHYLVTHGIELRWFHRWRWREPLRYNRRDHRKLLVIDRREAYLGGFNIHRENARSEYGERRWRDTHVRLYRPLATQAADLFDAVWQNRWRGQLPQLSSDTSSALLANHSPACRHALRCLYGSMLASARHTIWITTPYLVPDPRTLTELSGAARRGVDVRLLVPRRADVRLARWAANAVYTPLLQTGVRLYEYLPRVLHAKTLVVDGSWGSVGSANLDYRSLFLNYEINLLTRDLTVCQALADQFQQDLREAEELHTARWARRGLVRRLPEWIGWATKRWL